MKTMTVDSWVTGAFSCQHGLSLIELMIAMMLGLLLMSGVVGVVINSKTSFIAVRESAMLQENGRYAIELLTQEIRMAGYQECARNNAKLAISVKNAAGTWYLSWPGSATASPLQGLQGFDGVPSPGTDARWPADYRTNVAPNTDSLVVRRGDTTSYSAVLTAPTANVFRVNKATDFQQGELVMAVAPSCTQVSIFQATNTPGNTVAHGTGTGTPGNCNTDLSGAYNCDVEAGKSSVVYSLGTTLMRFNATAFYVGQPDDQPPALYRRKWSPPGGAAHLQTDELVRGVENMQIIYGLDTRAADGATNNNGTLPGDGVADTYINANDPPLDAWDAIVNWNSVVSVKVMLQLRSINPVYTGNTSFKKCDGTAGVADKYVHKCMTSTIAIRNQGL